MGAGFTCGNSSQGTTRLRWGPSCKGLTRQADRLQDPPWGATWMGKGWDPGVLRGSAWLKIIIKSKDALTYPDTPTDGHADH